MRLRAGWLLGGGGWRCWARRNLVRKGLLTACRFSFECGYKLIR